MTSFQRFYSWAEEQSGFSTLWRMGGPRNTDVEEVRMVTLEDETAIVTIYKNDGGFSVYRSEG